MKRKQELVTVDAIYQLEECLQMAKLAPQLFKTTKVLLFTKISRSPDFKNRRVTLPKLLEKEEFKLLVDSIKGQFHEFSPKNKIDILFTMQRMGFRDH